VLLEPIEKVIDGKTYILSKFPAVAGREILTQYPLSAAPKIGDYATNETMMLKIMCYVGVPMEVGIPTLMLNTKALIDNHVPNWETLLKIEWAMMEYNCSFFQNGRISTFLDECVQMLPRWITETLTPLLAQSLQTEKPRSKNSKKRTP